MGNGKLIADTIQHSSEGTIGTQYVVNGVAKLWGSFNGTTAAIDESFNVSSVTDDAVGSHKYTSTVTFAHNTKHGGVAVIGTNNIGFGRLAGGNCTTTLLHVFTHSHSGTNTDIDRALSVHGDLV